MFKTMKHTPKLVWFFGIGCLLIAVFVQFWVRNSTAEENPKAPLEHIIDPQKIKGVSFVAPPKPFKGDPFQEIIDHHIEWISVIPYAYTPLAKPVVKYNQTQWQWWGETRMGAEKTIELAHQKGIKVMLKPQVYIPRGWTGTMDYNSEEEWIQWENDYSKYILDMADLAKHSGVELFCIGTEFSVSVKKRLKYWLQLIAEIRKIYPGKICYSANWDHYEETPFWDHLDYIGISAYFPLTEEENPDLEKLKESWNPWFTEMKEFSNKLKKKILFTEFGYLTIDGAAGKTWELEQKIDQLKMNQTIQATAYEAILSRFWNEEFWAGGFVWKWFPEGEGHEGYPEKDYTPQGKLAAGVLRNWYQKN
ncbi:MAG: hypothetical protein IPO62_01925 [Saprospiraceae bacterium]|nr:hypothetical protein [Saprospiraceae bacterium]